MIWFHTVFLPAATLLAIALGIKKKAPWWKYAALVGGCALMLTGLWGFPQWSLPLMIAGGVMFFAGVPRGVTPAPAVRR